MNDWSRMREWIQGKLKKRSKMDFIIMLLIGALVLIVAIPDKKSGSSEQPLQQPEPEQTSSAQNDEQRTQLEKELEELLAQIAGVGKCKVMIMLEDDGRVCLDKDITIGEGRRSEETVVYRQDDGDAPYVVQQKRPQVAGVVVVAEGGENAGVATDISNAVMSLFQLEAHKITVVKMSVQEE